MENLKVEKLYQSTNEDIQRTNLLLRVFNFNDLIQRLDAYTDIKCSCKVTDYITINVRLCIIGNRYHPKHEISFLMSLGSTDNRDIYANIEARLLDSTGSVAHIIRPGQYTMMLEDIAWTMRKITPLKEIQRDPEAFLENGTLTFHLYLNINHKMVKVPDSPAVIKDKSIIRDKIHNRRFGETKFLVGGVEFFAHRNVLVRHSPLFASAIKIFEKKKLRILELPNIYPQVFERLVAACYLKEKEILKERFMYF